MDTATPWRIIAAWMPCCPCLRRTQPPQVVPTQEAAVRPSQVDGVARLEVTIQDLQNRLERVENRLDTEVARGEEQGGMVMNMQRYDLLLRSLEQVEIRLDTEVARGDNLAEIVTNLQRYDFLLRELRNSARLLRQIIHPDDRHLPIFVRPEEGDAPVNVWLVALVPDVDEDGTDILGYGRVQQTFFWNG